MSPQFQLDVVFGEVVKGMVISSKKYNVHITCGQKKCCCNKITYIMWCNSNSVCDSIECSNYVTRYKDTECAVLGSRYSLFVAVDDACGFFGVCTVNILESIVLCSVFFMETPFLFPL